MSVMLQHRVSHKENTNRAWAWRARANSCQPLQLSERVRSAFLHAEAMLDLTDTCPQIAQVLARDEGERLVEWWPSCKPGSDDEERDWWNVDSRVVTVCVRGAE
jgi:hypothetical protein